jgi:sugar/nucleoside kinase (ribokinase family)
VPDDPRLLVVGSIALDKREGPFGKVEEELGGSAVYFALAASLLLPITVSAPVGHDAVDQVWSAFEGRPIDTTHVEVIEAPTYRWTARQEHGHNVDLGSTDEIYDHWKPDIPRGYAGWAFVGSMRPDRQASAMKALHHSASLLAADAMFSYIKHHATHAKDVLRRAAWFFCNQQEFDAFGGKDPEEFRRQWWLDGLVLKAGQDGVTVYTPDGPIHVPALRKYAAFDTTGAGDALAGGMMGRWVTTGGQRGGLQDAIVCGVACASLTIEAVGIRGIAKATPQMLEHRMEDVWASIKQKS